MSASVDPFLPLSLLDAVRAVDLPSGDFDTELVHELRNKRFGLSDTVLAQLKRYQEAVRRNQRPSVEDARALEAARHCFLDSLACAFEALDHRDCTRLIGPGADESLLALAFAPFLTLSPGPLAPSSVTRAATLAATASADRRSGR
mgnify:CR=1 FL=1